MDVQNKRVWLIKGMQVNTEQHETWLVKARILFYYKVWTAKQLNKLNKLNKLNRGRVLRLYIVYLKDQVSQVA